MRSSRRSTNSSTWACPSPGRPEGKIAQRKFGGHTREFGKSAVERACYAADRTGHMILQTLYQQSIKDRVVFFNEFHVLDLILAGGECPGRGGLRAGHRGAAQLPRQGHGDRQRRQRADVQGDLQRPRPDRRPALGGLPARAPDRGSGVLPVPPDRALPDRGAADRGCPRRGGDPAQQRGGALHGALRPDHQGPGTPRPGVAGDLPRAPCRAGQRGPTRTTSCST